VNWPVDMPNPYEGGEYFAGNENVAGDDAGEEDMERDDLTRVNNATSTRSDDGFDDMFG